MGSPARTARPDPARKSLAGPGFFSLSGRARATEKRKLPLDRAGPSGQPGKNRAFSGRGPGSGQNLLKVGRAGPGSGQGFPVGLFSGQPEARPGPRNAQEEVGERRMGGILHLDPSKNNLGGGNAGNFFQMPVYINIDRKTLG
jgi:hypothetical protein